MNSAAPSFLPTRFPRNHHGAEPDQKSRSKVLPQSFGARHKLADARGFVEFFKPAFARWLQANFDSPEVVAASFGVRYQTALNWWNADNRASGDTVALAFMTFPDAVSWFLAEWEAR